MKWLTKIYDRFKWWEWFFSAPLVSTLYNLNHDHKITQEDYLLLESIWEAREPERGSPKWWRNKEE